MSLRAHVPCPVPIFLSDQRREACALGALSRACGPWDQPSICPSPAGRGTELREPAFFLQAKRIFCNCGKECFLLEGGAGWLGHQMGSSGAFSPSGRSLALVTLPQWGGRVPIDPPHRTQPFLMEPVLLRSPEAMPHVASPLCRLLHRSLCLACVPALPFFFHPCRPESSVPCPLKLAPGTR